MAVEVHEVAACDFVWLGLVAGPELGPEDVGLYGLGLGVGEVVAVAYLYESAAGARYYLVAVGCEVAVESVEPGYGSGAHAFYLIDGGAACAAGEVADAEEHVAVAFVVEQARDLAAFVDDDVLLAHVGEDCLVADVELDHAVLVVVAREDEVLVVLAAPFAGVDDHFVDAAGPEAVGEPVGVHDVVVEGRDGLHAGGYVEGCGVLVLAVEEQEGAGGVDVHGFVRLGIVLQPFLFAGPDQLGGSGGAEAVYALAADVEEGIGATGGYALDIVVPAAVRGVDGLGQGPLGRVDGPDFGLAGEQGLVAVGSHAVGLFGQGDVGEPGGATLGISHARGQHT